MDAASKAKDSLDEARQKRLLDKMAKDVDEILAETANTPIDEKEVERLRVLVATLEIRQNSELGGAYRGNEQSGLTKALLRIPVITKGDSASLRPFGKLTP